MGLFINQHAQSMGRLYVCGTRSDPVTPIISKELEDKLHS